MKSKINPIDVVIAWVDGSDKELIKKRKNYLNNNGNEIIPGANSTRFQSLNEINYCIFSILKFASFIRKIFIVTDNQKPRVHKLVRKYFPKRELDIQIIDHVQIFEGYESFLPTFNSICISNMLWRIKGLSNQFVYFNDDIFLTRSITPSDWFKDGRPVLRGKWVFPPYERIFWDGLKTFFQNTILDLNKDPTPSFQVNQWNAAKLFYFKFRYFRSGHVPLALDKRKLSEYFNTFPEILKENIKYRFRKYVQFNTYGG